MSVQNEHNVFYIACPNPGCITGRVCGCTAVWYLPEPARLANT